MMTRTDDLNIDWMQRADEILMANTCGPVDPQDRDCYEARLQRQRVVAAQYKVGFNQGRKEIALETLLAVGTKLFGAPTASNLARLNRMTDLDRMHELLDRMFDCDSWESSLAPVTSRISIWPAILKTLARICERSPDVRVGQMLAHLGFLSEDFDGQSLGVVEDEALLAVCEKHLVDLKARESAAPQSVSPDANKATGSCSATPVLTS